MSCANITHLKHRWRLITGSLCYNTRKWEEREDRRVGISHGSLLSDSNMDGWNTVSRLLRVRMRSVCVTYVQTFIAICAVLTRMQSTHPYTHIYIYIRKYTFSTHIRLNGVSKRPSLADRLAQPSHTHIIFWHIWYFIWVPNPPLLHMFSQPLGPTAYRISTISQKLYNLRCPRPVELLENFHSTLITHTPSIYMGESENRSTYCWLLPNH